MALHLRRPSPAALEERLRSCAGQRLTYEPEGISLPGPAAPPPPGLVRRTWSTDLAGGPSTFRRAAETLRSWGVQRGSGLVVVAEGSVALGVHVAMAAPLPVGFVEATCRVVAVVDEDDRSGFAYGTLPVHPEQGEESFVVERTAGGPVRFTVVAVSRPVHPLARLAPPVAVRLQGVAVRRYLDALRRAVGV